MPDNKIKYGIKNVYYAKATIASDNSATYATPVALPGAVSLSMEAQGENSPFYADNIVYWVGANNNGYEGDLELARIPDSFKKDILGYLEDNKGVLMEDANADATHFALLFQFEGDVKATKHVLYNCTSGRPAASGNTKTDTTEPQTESLSISATAIHNSSVNKDFVKADTTASTDSTAYSNWTSAVHQATALSV